MVAAAPASPAPSRGAVVRRWGPWLIIAMVVIAAGVVGLHRTSQPTLDQRTLSVAGQVRCPVCNGQSVAQSDAPPSLAIRSQIRTELAAGQAPPVILAGIVHDYGPGILEKPQAKGVGLIVWVVPVLAAAAAIVGLFLAFRRWRPAAVLGSGVSDRDRDLVGEALRTPPAPGSGSGSSRSEPGSASSSGSGSGSASSSGAGAGSSRSEPAP